MPFFQRDGLDFHYLDQGEGMPFLFQHGLGGDVTQPAGLYAPVAGVRFVALDARGHGDTRPLGDPARLTFDTLADDVLALLDHLGVERAIVGGISMGAGIALNLTLRYPERVRGLILSRPAWLDVPFPPNARPLAHIGSLIQEHGAARGKDIFLQSDEYAAALRESPDTANSLAGQFDHPRAEETAVKLERIPNDVPNRDRAAWSTITVPTLVLGNRIDPVHPYEYAETLAAAIPGATLRELTPKSVSVEQYTADTQRFISEFFKDNF